MSGFLKSVERALKMNLGDSYKKEQIEAGIKHSRNLEEAARRQRALDEVTSNMSPEEKAEYIAAERRSPESQLFRKEYKQDYLEWEKLGRPNEYGETKPVTPDDRAYEEALKKRQNYLASKKSEEKKETRRVLSDLEQLAPTKEDLNEFENFLDSGLSYADYEDSQKERGLSDKSLKQIKRGKIPPAPSKRSLLKNAKRDRDRKKQRGK